MTDINLYVSKENLDKYIPLLDEIPSDRVGIFNLDVAKTVALSLTVWKSYLEDAHLFVKYFNTAGFDPSVIEDLPARAGALWYADISLQQLSSKKSDDLDIKREAALLKKEFQSAAEYLWSDSEEISPIIAKIKSGAGQVDAGDDLVQYSHLFKTNWELANGRCAITLHHLEQALELGTKMVEIAGNLSHLQGERERNIRNRAGQHLKNGINYIRRAAAYIFEDQDISKRYPSLYQKQSQSFKS
ncbi:MAG: hypothetical protein JXR91_06480 [Deltaproteobacteria bacterium]|nr:hypothetical protein [Deltaproteobacteria bacterium]